MIVPRPEYSNDPSDTSRLWNGFVETEVPIGETVLVLWDRFNRDSLRWQYTETLGPWK